MKGKIILIVICTILIWVSCTTDDYLPLKEAYLDLPETPYDYSRGDNDHLTTLGRVLFYDRNLSINNSISCASCHKQQLGFADDVALSKGFDNRLTHRNSMPIQNLASVFASFGPGDTAIIIEPRPDFMPQTFTTLFWDGREKNLNSMVLRPIFNEIEMGFRDLNALNQKLAAIPYYNDLFVKAYGTGEVTTDKIAKALSSFLMNITSNKTKLDMAMRTSSIQLPLSPIEERGFKLFLTTYDCNSCHQVQSPNGYILAGTFANIGLEAQYADNGLQGVTQKASDAGKFKIPSLRNVVLTGPYMHDGRFSTLEEVLDHYSEGIANHPNLDHRLKGSDGQPMRMNIPEQDREAIIAFLHTLTDQQMITDIKFSDPFKAK